uniref:F-box domain-containing protein n=1 Tax=Mycena chlorophos TaxID=658473 RepID=A0ABQ0LCA9_MYCCL|nr:predicted protein [Mycena chlorophos]
MPPLSVAGAVARAKLSNLQLELAKHNTLAEAQIRALQNQLSAITFPVQILPLEITSQIFRVYHATAESRGDVARLDSSPMPLTRVCRLWRKIAFSMTELWSDVELDVGQGVPEMYGSMLSDWLNRSKHRLISLTLLDGFGAHSDTHWDAPIDMDDFGSILRQFASRIRTLKLIFLSPPELEKISAWTVDFPSLEETTIIPAEGIESPSWVLGLFGNTPSLRSVKVSDMWTPNLNISWCSLTRAAFDYVGLASPLGLSDLVHGLAQIPVLKQCSLVIRLKSDAQEPDRIVEPFRHVTVEDLSVSIKGDGHDLDRFFSAFTFPSLHTLRIRSQTELNPTTLPAFLARSNPPLERLTLDDATTSCLDLFCRFSRIEELTLHHPNRWVMCHFFGSMRRNSDLNYFPALRRLEFGCELQCDRQGSSRELLFDEALEIVGPAIRMRRAFESAQGTQRVQALRINYRLDGAAVLSCPEDQLAVLRELKQLGMDIYAGTHTGSII